MKRSTNENRQVENRIHFRIDAGDMYEAYFEPPHIATCSINFHFVGSDRDSTDTINKDDFLHIDLFIEIKSHVCDQKSLIV